MKLQVNASQFGTILTSMKGWRKMNKNHPEVPTAWLSMMSTWQTRNAVQRTPAHEVFVLWSTSFVRVPFPQFRKFPTRRHRYERFSFGVWQSVKKEEQVPYSLGESSVLISNKTQIVSWVWHTPGMVSMSSVSHFQLSLLKLARLLDCMRGLHNWVLNLLGIPSATSVQGLKTKSYFNNKNLR